MEYLKMDGQGLPAVLALWHSVFKDDENYICKALEDFVGKGNQYVAQTNGQLAAILSAVPCFCGNKKGVYLFALATRPGMRGRGIMQNLMQHAQQSEAKKGAVFAVLIPANAKLFAFYNAKGYINLLSLQCLSWVAQPTSAGEAPQRVGISALGGLRKKMLKQPAITFNKKATQFIYNDIKQSGGLLYKTSAAYALAFNAPTGLHVAELCAHNEQAAKEMLNQLCSIFKVETAIAHLPFASGFFAGQTKAKKHALVKYFSGSSIETMHLRFALEDVFA